MIQPNLEVPQLNSFELLTIKLFYKMYVKTLNYLILKLIIYIYELYIIFICINID